MALQRIEIIYDVDKSQLEDASEEIREQARLAGLTESEVEELNAEYKKQAKNISDTSKEQRKQLGIIEQLRKRETELLAARDKSQDETQIQRYNSELLETRTELRRLTSEANSLGEALDDAVSSSSGLSDIGNIAIGNIAADLFQGAISGAREYITELTRIQNATEILFGNQGQDVDEIAARVQALANVYDRDYNEVLRSANALSKSFEITGVEALTEINRLLNQGTDLSGDFLQQISEYSTFFAQGNQEASDLVDLLIAAEKAGTFNDKAADSVKEFFLSIQEGSDATREAFSGIGINFSEELARIQSGEGSFTDLLEETTSRLSELDTFSPQVGAAIADIFRGAGQDAGTFLQSLNEITETARNQVTELTPYQELQLILVEIQTEFGKVAGSISDALLPVAVSVLGVFRDLVTVIGENGQQFATLATTILTAVTAQKAFNVAQLLLSKNLNLGQLAVNLFRKGFSSLNTVIRANPIGLAVTAIGLLVIAFQEVAKDIDGARESVSGFFSTILSVTDRVPILGTVFRTVFSAIRSVIGFALDALEDFPATFAGVRAALETFVTNAVIGFERFKLFFESLGLEIKQAFTFDDEADAAIQRSIDAIDARRDALANSGKSLAEAYNEARDQALADNPPDPPEIPTQDLEIDIKPSISAQSVDEFKSQVVQAIGDISAAIDDIILNIKPEIDFDAEALEFDNDSEIAINFDVEGAEQVADLEAQISRERASSFAAQERANQRREEEIEQLKEIRDVLSSFSSVIEFDEGGLIDLLKSFGEIDLSNPQDALSVFQAGLQTTLGAINSFSDNREARKEKERDALVKLEEETGQSQASAIAEVDKEIEQIQRNRFRREQASAIAEITIQTALAVTKTLPNLILSGIVAGIGLAQLGIVLSTPAPFKEGVFDLGNKESAFKIPGKGNATSDSIPARLSQGETVFSNKRTVENHEVFKRISKGELLKPKEVDGKTVYTFDKELQKKQLSDTVEVYYKIVGYDSPEIRDISQKIDMLESKSIYLKEEIERIEKLPISTKEIRGRLSADKKELADVKSSIERIKSLDSYVVFKQREAQKETKEKEVLKSKQVLSVLSKRNTDIRELRTKTVSKEQARNIEIAKQGAIMREAFEFDYSKNAKAIAAQIVKEQASAMWKDGHIIKSIWNAIDS